MLVLSMVSLLLSGRWSSASILTRAALLLGGPIDGILGAVLFKWLGLSSIHIIAGGLMFGLMSMMFLQPMLLPQRLVVWRLARENIRRRKRQAVLLVAGLVISSSIITSSLVVGDSLDATVTNEVTATWTQTDILIAGLDPMTGAPVDFDESIGERLWNALANNSSISSSLLGRQYGLSATVSITSEQGRAEPSVPLFGLNSSIDALSIWDALDVGSGLRFDTLHSLDQASTLHHVVINEVAAESLEIKAGETVEFGVFVNKDDSRVRTTVSAVVHAIVPNRGQAAMAGTLSPAIFVDLQAAQTMLSLDGRINQIMIALDDDLSPTKIREMAQGVQVHLDASLSAEDVGIVFTKDTASSSVSVSSSSGLQRISGHDVVALRENLTTLLPQAMMLEVLQIPLIDVEVHNESLLTLADRDIMQLKLGDYALWHTASSGVGFESLTNSTAWLWQVEEGSIIHDVAFDSSANRMTIGLDSGVISADVWLTDEEQRERFDTEDAVMALAATEDGWIALTVSEANSLKMLELSPSLGLLATHQLTISTPTTVLSYSLLVQDGIYLAIQGLLSVSHYFTDSLSTPFQLINAEQWPVESESAQLELHESCDGQAVVRQTNGEQWCTYEHGLMRWNTTTNEVLSIRLPVLSDAPGFGRFPQMFLAFGGGNASLVVEHGEVLTSKRLQLFALESSQSNILVKGVLPYAYGNDSATALVSQGEYTALPGFEQLADLDAVVLGLVSLADGEELAMAEEDARSLLMFSGLDVLDDEQNMNTALEMWWDERSTSEDLFLNISAVQLDAQEQAEASSKILAAMFLVFGSFTIAAGVLLSLTIIMLLADVRQRELAAVRALGLRRSDARALFVLEGSVLALFASGIGTLLGLVFAWLISVGFSSIFTSVGAQAFTFAWSMDSVFSGWIWGSLFSILLLWLSAVYNAQLNIIRGLRGGRPPRKAGVPWGVFLVQVLALGLVGLSLLSLLLLGLDHALAYASYVGFGVAMILLLTPFVMWQVPVWLSKQELNTWTRHCPRNTIGGIGVLFLAWTLLLAPFDPIRLEMQPNELAFIFLGLLQVLSGVMVLTSWAPITVQWLSKRRVLGKKGHVRAVALAHPLAQPIRSAVVMGMFSITMFSVVVLAGYTAQFDAYSSGFVEEAEGEFELLLTSSRSRPITLDEDPLLWGIDAQVMSNIDAVGGVYRAPVHLQDAEGKRMPYVLRGVDDGFTQHGGLPLYLWDESLGETSEEAWISIGNLNDVVFLDASFGLESSADGSTLVPLRFSIGDSILLIDFTNPKNTKEVWVGGFLMQSSYIFSPGVWIDSSVAVDQFDGELTRMYVSVGPDAQASRAEFANLEVLGQGKSIHERQAAAELEVVLGAHLSSMNINVQTVADEITVIQSLVLAILSLFEGYLALGLFVGVAGIGVVTVRNVSERRRTIGMLRALGYRQRDVLHLFSIEVSWLALLGMLNGFVIGYGFHMVLYNALWKDEGVRFAFPWTSTLGILLGCWLVVLASTAIPVRQASRIPPSAALRSHTT